jgi:hypothetical protein
MSNKNKVNNEVNNEVMEHYHKVESTFKLPLDITRNKNKYMLSIEGMPLNEYEMTVRETITLIRGIGFYLVYKSYGKKLEQELTQ